MKSYYLKFASEQEAKSVLWTAETVTEFDPETEESTEVTVLDEDGEHLFSPNYRNISVIGTIYNDDAVFGEDEEGLPTTVSSPTTKEGWHVNVLALSGEDTTAIEEYSIEVATPSRVWGGQ